MLHMEYKHLFLKAILFFIIMPMFSQNKYSDTEVKLSNESMKSPLIVEFTNPKWNGKEVPEVGICTLCGGEGNSPELKVSNIPDSANTIIVEFNDRDYSPLSYNGGHGSISIDCVKRNEVIVPSIPEQTFDVPKGVKTEHAHRAPKGNQGTYLGPCSCGYGNRYFAVIKAVFRSQGKDDKILAQKTIELGTH